MSRILRVILCYPDGDRIIVDKISDLKKYDLTQCSAFDVTVAMNLTEFENLLRQQEQS